MVLQVLTRQVSITVLLLLLVTSFASSLTPPYPDCLEERTMQANETMTIQLNGTSYDASYARDEQQSLISIDGRAKQLETSKSRIINYVNVTLNSVIFEKEAVEGGSDVIEEAVITFRCGDESDNATNRTFTTYNRDGTSIERCATCGNEICEDGETCTSSTTKQEDGVAAATTNCGPLHCPEDCTNNTTMNIENADRQSDTLFHQLHIFLSSLF